MLALRLRIFGYLTSMFVNPRDIRKIPNVWVSYKKNYFKYNILTIAEEELVELRGEGSKEAAEGGDEAAYDSGDARRLAHAQRNRHRGEGQRHTR